MATTTPCYGTATELQVQIISNAHALHKHLVVADMTQKIDFHIIITKNCEAEGGVTEYHAVVVTDASNANFIQGPVSTGST